MLFNFLHRIVTDYHGLSIVHCIGLVCILWCWRFSCELNTTSSYLREPKPKQAQLRHDRVEKDLLPPGGRENRGVVLKMMLSRNKGRVGDCLGRPVESWEGHIPAHKCSRVGKMILEVCCGGMRP